MPTEDQLKSQMQAAIAKKKANTESASIKETIDESGVSKSKTPTKVDHVYPAIYQSTDTIPTTEATQVDPDPAVSSEAELTRTFFGRPIRVAIYQKQIFFAVYDVLNVSNDPDKLELYQELHQSTQKNNFLEGIIVRMKFPSPNGGHDKLDAATDENLIKIIHKLELKFPEPIEKWLLNITESLTVLL